MLDARAGDENGLMPASSISSSTLEATGRLRDAAPSSKRLTPSSSSSSAPKMLLGRASNVEVGDLTCSKRVSTERQPINDDDTGASRGSRGVELEPDDDDVVAVSPPDDAAAFGIDMAEEAAGSLLPPPPLPLLLLK